TAQAHRQHLSAADSQELAADAPCPLWRHQYQLSPRTRWWRDAFRAGLSSLFPGAGFAEAETCVRMVFGTSLYRLFAARQRFLRNALPRRHKSPLGCVL